MLLASPLNCKPKHGTTFYAQVSSYEATVAQCGKSNGITASGQKVKKGVVAADPKVFPYGTILYCHDTNEIWVVSDCGGAIKGNKIDRFVTNWKPGKYKGGKLKATVLYLAPKSKDRLKKVQASFKVREHLLRDVSNRHMSSRGGKAKAVWYTRHMMNIKLKK